MEISITAVTRDRKFSKSLVRHTMAVAPLKQVALHVNTSKLAFDVLQLVFMDGGENYAKGVGCKDTRPFSG